MNHRNGRQIQTFALLFIYLFHFFSVKVCAKKQGIQDSIANGSTSITKTQTVTDIQSSNFIYTLHRFFMNTEHVSFLDIGT